MFFRYSSIRKNVFVCLLFSFVRSTTMDKWKDLELEKMKVSGNRPAKDFMESHGGLSGAFNEKWNSKTAALYRDKVCVVTFSLLQYSTVIYIKMSSFSDPETELLNSSIYVSIYLFFLGTYNLKKLFFKMNSTITYQLSFVLLLY